MAIKGNISKLFFITLWSIVGAGVLVLLIAAISHRNSKTCKGYRIDISGGRSPGLCIDKKAISGLLFGEAGRWQDKPILSFDLRRIESTLKKNVWIRDVQLYFDNNGILRVNVTERDPVARIFTLEGNSFYIDSSGVQLPLSDKLTVKLPVFTGFPDTKVRLHGADSALIGQVRKLSAYIRKDPFWMAQIAQVAITPGKGFEMVPVIGEHVIVFGDGNDYEQKLHRLFVFYKEVLSRTGFDKYAQIDVEYAGQVIGTKKSSPRTRVDSLQGMRNIQQLIRGARQLQPDTVRQRDIRPLERGTQTEQSLMNYDLIPGSGDSVRPASRLSPRAVMPPKGGDRAKERKQLNSNKLNL